MLKDILETFVLFVFFTLIVGFVLFKAGAFRHMMTTSKEEISKEVPYIPAKEIKDTFWLTGTDSLVVVKRFGGHFRSTSSEYLLERKDAIETMPATFLDGHFRHISYYDPDKHQAEMDTVWLRGSDTLAVILNKTYIGSSKNTRLMDKSDILSLFPRKNLPEEKRAPRRPIKINYNNGN